MFLCMKIYIFQYKALQGTIIQQTHIGKPLIFYRETKQAYLLELQIFMWGSCILGLLSHVHEMAYWEMYIIVSF